MGLGPVEVLVIAFPGNDFNGAILPELEALVESDTINVIDGLLVLKDDAGDIAVLEFSEIGLDSDAARLADLMQQVDALISDDDIATLAEELAPNSSEAILVFEHTWAKPLRDAIVGSGGVLTDNFRISGEAVDELIEEINSLDDADV